MIRRYRGDSVGSCGLSLCCNLIRTVIFFLVFTILKASICEAGVVDISSLFMRRMEN